MQDEERLSDPVPRLELERRWNLARSEMNKLGVDAIIVQGANNMAGGGGYFRWLTGLPSLNSNPETAIFPSEGLITLVGHGAADGEICLDDHDPAFAGVGMRFTTASFPMVAYTAENDARVIAREIIKGRFRTIAFVGISTTYYRFAALLQELLERVAILDATAAFDRLRAVKGLYEVDQIRAAAAMQDDILAQVPSIISPGMRDYEVMVRAQLIGELAGSFTGYFLGSSAPPGVPALMRLRPQQHRRIEAGDVLLFQAENSGPGGYYVHAARYYVLGKAPQELVDRFHQMVEAQDFTLNLLKPGVSAADAFAEYNNYMISRNLAPERRLHCHSQGYDVVERPLLRAEETMTIDAGMNIGIHPVFLNERVFATVCDNFLIGADGTAERLHKTPRQIIEL